MFTLGIIEIIVLGLIAFLVFGPKQFPIVVKNFVRLLNELKQTFSDIQTEFHDVETKIEKQIHEITEEMHEKKDTPEEKNTPKKEQKQEVTKVDIKKSTASASPHSKSEALNKTIQKTNTVANQQTKK